MSQPRIDTHQCPGTSNNPCTDSQWKLTNPIFNTEAIQHRPSMLAITGAAQTGYFVSLNKQI
jgi:hypothetical protein